MEDVLMSGKTRAPGNLKHQQKRRRDSREPEAEMFAFLMTRIHTQIHRGKGVPRVS